MARGRARLSKRSKYYISYHDFNIVYNYALKYNEWKAEYDTSIGLTSGRGNGNGTGDPTALQAIRLSDLAERINLIESTAYEAEPEIYPYLLAYVTTESLTFDMLKAQGLPCERNMFYDRRRRFYYLLKQKLKL